MTAVRQHVEKIPVDRGMQVSAVLAEPAAYRAGQTDVIVLAHGAGTDMHHPFMTFFHESLAKAGWLSVKFNFPYKELGRKAPDPGPRLGDAFERVLAHVRETLRPAPGRLFIGGKSMGGRIAANVAAREADAGEQGLAGLVFLGYPLHAPKRHDRLRADNLVKIAAPMLFVEGTNDPFCRLDLLAEVLERVRAPARTHVIEGGNHDFRVPKRLGREAEDIWREVVETICEWRAA
ncbi:MAG: alpha/beta hydrolase fold domain-containing protein [Deltaproteobacteria bacterium]|nr:alpha/beta hydrolase fold domain-containing protein [Deltaproteobacteria bacterium]